MAKRNNEQKILTLATQSNQPEITWLKRRFFVFCLPNIPRRWVFISQERKCTHWNDGGRLSPMPPSRSAGSLGMSPAWESLHDCVSDTLLSAGTNCNEKQHVNMMMNKRTHDSQMSAAFQFPLPFLFIGITNVNSSQLHFCFSERKPVEFTCVTYYCITPCVTSYVHQMRARTKHINDICVRLRAVCPVCVST